MSSNESRVFLSYARPDEKLVADVYRRLVAKGIDVWFDKESIKAGEEWEPTIKKALRSAKLVLVFLSKHTTTRDGFLNKEIHEALQVWDEKAPGKIYLIPVRLSDHPIHERLTKFHWVDIFEDRGWQKLVSQILDSVGTLSVDLPKDRRSPNSRRLSDRSGFYARRVGARSIPHIAFPEEVVRFATSCMPGEAWSAISEDSKRFIATLGSKLEPIIQIVPATPMPLVLGFECLGLGSLGESFPEICKATSDLDPGLVRLCLAVVAIKTISQLRVEAIKHGHSGARNLIFSVNLDPFMLESPHLKTFLKWYYHDLAHNVIFEVNETTTKQYLGKLKNLQVDYNLRYSADDLNAWHEEVRTALLPRVEMTKMDYKSFVDAMAVRGDDKDETLRQLLAHNLVDKPLIVEGIQDPDYLEFLERHWDFKKYGYLYGQGYLIEPGLHLKETVRPLKDYGLPGGSFLMSLDPPSDGDG
jgi:hypothetical protein